MDGRAVFHENRVRVNSLIALKNDIALMDHGNLAGPSRVIQEHYGLTGRHDKSEVRRIRELEIAMNFSNPVHLFV